MKEFNISEGAGELIIHLNADNSAYEVIYDHGQIIFQNAGLRYIIPENVGNKVSFLAPDPNTGKRTYIADNVRSLYRDTTPTDFGLSNLTNVEIGSSHFTEEIVVGGINESIPVVAPAGVVIYVNGSAVSSGSMVELGDVVKFEIPASTEFETTSNFNLTVGDITKNLSITTEIGIRQNCQGWYNSGFHTDGIYRVSPDGSTEFDVYCNMTTDGGGWTLVWSHILNMANYRPAGLNWTNSINTTPLLSHTMTANKLEWQVYTGLKFWNQLGGNQMMYEWDEGGLGTIDQRAVMNGYIDSSSTNYTLRLTTINNTVGSVNPGLYDYHNNRPFSTYDADHDASSGNCSSSYGNTPWWYGSCWSGSINGGYTANHENGAFWRSSSTTSNATAGDGGGNGWLYVR